MPNKQRNKKELAEKQTQREFGRNLSYSNKDDRDYYNQYKDEFEYQKFPYFVQSGPAIAPQNWTFYGYMEDLYPRVGFYTYMPGETANTNLEYLDQYKDQPALYYWDKGSGFLNVKHYPQVALPGDDNYPELIDKYIYLSNAAGVPAYAGQSPQVSKQLPELIVTPNKKRFLIKRQEGGLLNKIKLVGTELGKAALPGYYTWESGKELYNDIGDDNVSLGETLKDTGKFILDLGLDAATFIPGAAALTVPAKTARAAKAGVKGVQAIQRANGAARATRNYMRAGNKAAAVVARDAEKQAMRQATKYGRETIKAEQNLQNARNLTRMWPQATAVTTMGRGIVNNSNNSVEKTNKPYLYNDFTQ